VFCKFWMDVMGVPFVMDDGLMDDTLEKSNHPVNDET